MEKNKADATVLEFETMKFNVAWTKWTEAKEENKLDADALKALKATVDRQGELLEKLGGSLPAEMMTLEQSQEKAKNLAKDLSVDKLMKMTNEERFMLAQSLGPAFPISLILSYTAYWSLNIPFIAYAYFATVTTGQTTFALVMAGAYATSIPFKPLVYIAAILGSGWTAENILPFLYKVLGMFRLPDENDFDRL